MSETEIVDPINLGTAAELMKKREPGEGPPMAMCRCGEPLICTLEFSGAEFYCQVCTTKYGFLGPTPKPWTQELQDRHDELHAAYTTARAERAAARS